MPNRAMRKGKEIKDFPGYWIEPDGKIWSEKAGKYMKPSISKCGGYQYVVLSNCGRRKHIFIHRALLEHYIGPCPKGRQCRHLNGNPINNRLENLCWGTSAENVQDSFRHKTHAGLTVRGEKKGAAKLSEDDVRKIVYLSSTFNFKGTELAMLYNVSKQTIYDILHKRYWKHVWEK